MQFLTQTKWPFWVIVLLAGVLFVLQNRNILTVAQVEWLLGALAIGGTQAGVHTEKPEPKGMPAEPPMGGA